MFKKSRSASPPTMRRGGSPPNLRRGAFTGSARRSPSPIIQYKQHYLKNPLDEAIKIWIGLSVVGMADTTSNQTKNIGYSANNIYALRCFQSKSKEKCDTYNYCRFNEKVQKCLPSESRNELSEGSFINMEPDGDVYRIVNVLKVDVHHGERKLKTYIRILEPVHAPSSLAVIVFPIGFPVLIDMFALDRIKNIAHANINTKRKVILCGHSMGGLWAQQLASYLVHLKINVDNVYVVGSGTKIWTDFNISSFYPDRWMFFCTFRKSGDYKTMDPSVGGIVTKNNHIYRNYNEKLYATNKFNDDVVFDFDTFNNNLFTYGDNNYVGLKTLLLGEGVLFDVRPDNVNAFFIFNTNINNEINIWRSKTSNYMYGPNDLHEFSLYKKQINSYLRKKLQII